MSDLQQLIVFLGNWADYAEGKREERMADMATLAHYWPKDAPDIAALLTRHGSSWPDQYDPDLLIWFMRASDQPNSLGGAGLTRKGWMAYKRVLGGNDLTEGENDDDPDADEDDYEDDETYD